MFLSEKDISDLIKKKSFELGFNLAGFAKAEILINEKQFFLEWLDKNYNAKMGWLERTFEKRVNPFLIMPDAKSVITMGLNYFQNISYSNTPDYGKISRYAAGKDYHEIIEKKNEELIKYIRTLKDDIKAVSFIDSGPTMDKVWAVKSGLGWLGKNACVINPKIGSWFFISVIITNMDIESSESINDKCGKCTSCIDACPTNAITDAYQLNSNKCISYITIENKDEIPDSFSGKMNNWIFGCDICQEVCPWNKKNQRETDEKNFTSSVIGEINFSEFENINEELFKLHFKDRAIKRTKFKGLKRNIEFIKKEFLEIK